LGTTPWFAWTQINDTPLISRELWSAMQRIQSQSMTRPHVLTDTQTARLVVAFGNAKVYAGNFYKTPDFLRRALELRLLGVEPDDSDAPGVHQIPWPTLSVARQRWDVFRATARIDWVLIPRKTPLAHAIRQQGIMKETDFGTWSVFGWE
jgi:hypothetical protein